MTARRAGTRNEASEPTEPAASLRARYRAGERDFSGEDHHAAQAADCNLEGARFTRCDFEEACLEAANLTHTNFDEASLVRACLDEVDLSHATLRRAVLDEAELEGAVLHEADLGGASLQDANLQHADLTDAQLVDAKLDCADLRSAELSGANLSGCSLTHAALKDAVVSATTILPTSFDPGGRGMLLRSGDTVVPLTARLLRSASTPRAAPAFAVPWWVRPDRVCDRCSVPLAHKHQMGAETVCTACFLHDRGARSTGDVGAALALMADREICAYCGEHAATDERIAGGSLGGTLDVKCCKECRELSGRRTFSDFTAKRDFLKKALATRYAHVAGAREWDATELGELEGNLQMTTALREQARKIVQGRLEFDFRKLIGC